MNPASTCSISSSARLLIWVSPIPPIGCWQIATGSSFMPRERFSTCPSFSNNLVDMVTLVTPSFSNSTESWILHDVHDPQSASPTITISHCLANSSIISESAGIDAVDLCLYMTWFMS